jgi:hypothetical protein
MNATKLIASLAVCAWSAHAAIVINPVSISIMGSDEFFPAVNMINGSGLEVPLNTGDTLPATSNHNYGDPANTSWVSGAFGFPSDWYAASGTIPTFVLDLGQQRLLDSVHLWAYAGGTGVAGTVSGNSARLFEFRFNTEAQGNLNFLGPAVTVDLDHGALSEMSGFILPRQDFLTGTQNARYVEMRITDNWYVAPGDGTTMDQHGHLIRGGDRVGLGEIRFSVVPEPSTWALLGSALALLPATRRRRGP